MPKFNIEKLNSIKNSQFLTLKEISDRTGIPHSTISKIFSGFNSNPSIDSVLKIAEALECGIDDFIDYENQPKSPYYIDRQIEKIAESIYENAQLKILFELCKNLSQDDLFVLIQVSKRLK